MRFPRPFFAFVFLFTFVLQACGGGSSSTTTPTPVNMSGTAATGAAVANATITVKDAAGASKTATTGADGKYTIDVAGMTAPFLVKVDLPVGTALYSVGGAAGVVNVHPFTNLIIKTWYEVQGKTMDAAFADPAGNPPPSSTEIKVIAIVVEEIVQKWLVDKGIDPANFDLISTPFDANGTGFDGVLDLSEIAANGTITINDGTTTQTTTITPNTTDGSATVATTTTSGGNTSSSVSTTVVPTSAAQQTALSGVGTALNQFATIVNSKGAALADSDLSSLFDPGYLSDGFGASIGAAHLASDLRGAAVNSFTVDRLLSYDDTNKVVSIVGSVSITVDGVTLNEKFTADDGFSFKQQAGGTWLIYGNQRPASGGLSVEMRTDVFPPCPQTTISCGTFGPRKSINIDVRAAKGTISTVTISGGGLFTNANVPKSGTTDFEEIAATPTTTLTLEKDAFFLSQDLTDFPPAGTVFTFTVTPVSGPVSTFTVATVATTTEPISLTAPTGHTLADATLDQPLTVTWTRPTTFAVESINLGGHVSTSLDPNAGFSCQVDVDVAATASSGAITFPSTCNNQPTAAATINVSANGPNGERNIVLYFFGN